MQQVDQALRQRLAKAGGLAVQRNLRTEGFSFRKRQLLKEWLVAWLGVSSPPEFADELEPYFVWGAGSHSERLERSSKLIRVEDGMLRSVGLGADLMRPISWVFDTTGIYFDATKPSDLELILKNCDFTPVQLQRAQALRLSLVQQRITKYNIGGATWRRPANRAEVVLVAGQVETDASIRLGCAHVRSNEQLILEVRKMRPNAYVVYKPHPDVLAGLRAGQLASNRPLWDELVLDVAIEAMYPQIDELHVMTSLAGFEALLRGVKVVCYGMPFYAGWGLCEAPHMTTEVLARRGRELSLEQLVAGTLLDYASYRNPEDGAIWTAEQAVAWLASQSSTYQPATWFKRKVLSLIAKKEGRF